MPNTARTGFGTLFRRGATVIGEIQGIDGLNRNRATFDASHTAMTDPYKEFIGGLVDAGEVSFQMHFTRDANQILMEGDMESPAPVTYSVQFNTSPTQTCTFLGLVTEMTVTAPIEDKMTYDVSIKLSGKPIWS